MIKLIIGIGIEELLEIVIFITLVGFIVRTVFRYKRAKLEKEIREREMDQ